MGNTLSLTAGCCQVYADYIIMLCGVFDLMPGFAQPVALTREVVAMYMRDGENRTRDSVGRLFNRR